MAKKKKDLAKKCPVVNCTKRLTEAFVTSCPKCGEQAVCHDHKYDHACDPKKEVSPQTTSSVSVVKKKVRKQSVTSTDLYAFVKKFDPKSKDLKVVTKNFKTFVKSFEDKGELKLLAETELDSLNKKNILYLPILFKTIKYDLKQITTAVDITNPLHVEFITGIAREYKHHFPEIFETLFNFYDVSPKLLQASIRKCLPVLIKYYPIEETKSMLDTLLPSDSPPNPKLRALQLAILTNLSPRTSLPVDLLLHFLLSDIFGSDPILAKAADKCLTSLSSQIRTPEIIQLQPLIFDALRTNSASLTFRCLEELLDLTVVNPIGSTELALMFPLLKLALHQRDSPSVQAGLVTIANICPLVEDVGDLVSKRDELIPKIQKLLDDSNPKTRELAMKAKNEILTLESDNVIDNADIGDEEFLVHLPKIILGFASRLLLKRTKLAFKRGHVYGFVGNNGVGKTTLLNRLAKKDIANFPQDLKVHYVRHEIISDAESPAKFLNPTGELSDEAVSKALDTVGFQKELLGKTVTELSGGWKMKLAVAESMLTDCQLLLLDEPTNHLDVASVEFLTEYLRNLAQVEKVTICLVTHDYDFIDAISTDIVHIADQRLTYYPCTFHEFQELKPEIVAALPKKDAEENDMLSILAGDQSSAAYQEVLKQIKPIQFPEGQKLSGLSSRGKPVLSLLDVKFAYPETTKTVINGVQLRLNLNSRIALLGKNGQGKTTLLKLILGVLEPTEGKVWRHQNVRLSYIAQHSLHHLEANLEKTACQYIQARFYEGRDKELSKFLTLKLTEEEEEQLSTRGEICEVVSRVSRGKKLFYEVRKHVPNKNPEDIKTEFKDITELERLGKMHAVKLCRMFDEKMKAQQSGVDLRPVTTDELIKHLKEFGIEPEIATRKVRWMSGGQKCRLVLAAAMWTKPHVVALDEPTNYLDNETLAALTAALRGFRGGVVVVSHHEGFVSALAKELWHVEEGRVRIEQVQRGP